jgi:hypothetical protein
MKEYIDNGVRVTCLDCPNETAIIFNQDELSNWCDGHKDHGYSLRLEHRHCSCGHNPMIPSGSHLEGCGFAVKAE